ERSAEDHGRAGVYPESRSPRAGRAERALHHRRRGKALGGGDGPSAVEEAPGASRGDGARTGEDGLMGLRDVLFGKKKLAGPARERLFALTTAAVTLDTELGLKTTGVGGVVFKPLSAGELVRAENDRQQ